MTARFLSSPHWHAMVKDLVWTFSRKSLRRPDNLYFTLLHKSSLRVIFPHQRGYLGIRNWSFWEGGTCAKDYIIVRRIFKSLYNGHIVQCCTMGTCQLTSAIVFNSDMGYPCPDHTQNTVMMMISVAVYCRKSEDIIIIIAIWRSKEFICQRCLSNP